MIEIKIIDHEHKHKQDINIKNEPFKLWGAMIPSLNNGKWSYTIQKFSEDKIGEQCFPDENYDYDAMTENSVFAGAYDNGQCIGLAVFQEDFFKYMYLYDLKVNKAYHKQGVASALIEKGKEIAAQKGDRGIYTQGQDNNLSACLFYVKTGFHIGGFNTDVYKGTKQEGKSDIFFIWIFSEKDSRFFLKTKPLSTAKTKNCEHLKKILKITGNFYNNML